MISIEDDDIWTIHPQIPKMKKVWNREFKYAASASSRYTHLLL